MLTINTSTSRNMRFDHQPLLGGKWSDFSGDRISILTSTKMLILCFKLAKFIFYVLDSRSKMQTITTNFMHWNRSGKKRKLIAWDNPLSRSGNSWAFVPHPNYTIERASISITLNRSKCGDICTAPQMIPDRKWLQMISNRKWCKWSRRKSRNGMDIWFPGYFNFNFIFIYFHQLND